MIEKLFTMPIIKKNENNVTNARANPLLYKLAAPDSSY